MKISSMTSRNVVVICWRDHEIAVFCNLSRYLVDRRIFSQKALIRFMNGVCSYRKSVLRKTSVLNDLRAVNFLSFSFELTLLKGRPGPVPSVRQQYQ